MFFPSSNSAAYDEDVDKLASTPSSPKVRAVSRDLESVDTTNRSRKKVSLKEGPAVSEALARPALKKPASTDSLRRLSSEHVAALQDRLEGERRSSEGKTTPGKRSLVRVEHGTDGSAQVRSVGSVLLPRKSGTGIRERLSSIRVDAILAELHRAGTSNLNRIDSEGESVDSFDPSEGEIYDPRNDDTYLKGFVIDFIVRHGGRRKRRSASKEAKTCGLTAAFDLIGLVMDETHGLFGYAQEAVARDELESLIWEDIVEFYKNDTEGAGKKINKASWPKVSSTRLRDHVRSILLHKRHVNNLSTEVASWIFRYCLLNPQTTDHGETVGERHNRLNEFWNQYHALGKLSELPPIATIDSPRSKKSSKEKPITTKFIAKSSICFDAKRQWREVEYVESQAKRPALDDKLPEWKSRHGMVFDEHGLFSMKWQTREPAAGTRAALIRQEAKGRAYRANLQANEEPLLHQSSSLPSLRPSQGSPVSPLSHVSKDGDTPPTLSDEPTERYLLACRRCGVRPIPIAFVTGHSAKLQAAGKDLTDSDLRAIAAMIQHVRRIEEINLSDNAMLTEGALVPFLRRLVGEPAESTLQALILRNCQHVGLVGLEAICGLLAATNGARNLKTLDLSEIKINAKPYMSLAKAIGNHVNLESLFLADTSLGTSSGSAKDCVGHILRCSSLHHLDIGWNCFNSDIFFDIGQLVALRGKIKSLCMRNCAADTFGNNSIPPPITFFLEFLSLDDSLTKLDVSLNRMDFRSMLVIEDHLEKNKRLEKLDISENPLGILGMRSALRLLSVDSSGLIFFDCAGSYSGSEIGAQTFNMTNPGGHYCLDLSRPYHRTILRMLYKSCERMKQPPEQIFKQIKFTKPWSHCTKDVHGIYQIPREGRFECNINIEVAIEHTIKANNHDFASFVDEHASIMKMQPHYRKVIPLFACWKRLDGQTVDQAVFLDAMSKDFYLTPAYLESFTRFSKSLKSETIHRILPCVRGGHASLALGLLLVPSVGEFMRLHKIMRAFLDFNIMNPTGHYKLRLESVTDYFVAERLMLLDRWEVVLDRKLKRFDTSQRGNRSHIRNERYRGNQLDHEVYSLAEWTLPEIDVLELDYISGKRCPADAIVLNHGAFDNILVGLFDAECRPLSKIEVLRKLSHHVYITSTQMRALLGCFKTQHERAEVFVALYLQIVDVWNAKVFRVRFDSVAEVRNLQERLGYATFFPFIQPENAFFNLDLKVHDQRLCASLVVQLAKYESSGNIHEPQWIHADGKEDPLTVGVPQGWSKFAEAPKEGIFRCRYMSAPENRKFSARCLLGETYGAFRMNVKEDKVMWWTGLNEPPPDVLLFLEFILAKYNDVWKAFTVIDGVGGNGEITLKEFRDGVVSMHCKKFKGHDEKERVDKVFRYLDPGGEGTVSKGEWDILHQLQSEYRLCITEFVHFLRRIFGDMQNAWKNIDKNGDGDLTLEEWLEAVERIGYFGPSECVFGILDHSGDGNISEDEFEVLTKYVIDDGHAH